MIEFLIHITLAEQILLGLLLVLFIYQAYFYIRFLAAPLWHFQRLEGSKVQRFEGSKVQKLKGSELGCSVVICAKNEGENLLEFLPTILEQDYPLYEVIVVNDGSEDNTAEVLAQFAQQYKHLHLTFVPRQAQVRSSKKLALTIGIKAAQYDYILLTDADCRPASKHWIADMMGGFSQDERTKDKGQRTKDEGQRTEDGGRRTFELVLGYGAYLKEKTIVNRFIQYDTLFNGLQYMGLAIAHHPYMGVGRNLAYKKETFFANKGFAGLLNARAGDDDLFVNKVATHKNTNVVLTRDSITWSIPKHTYRDWLIQKERHLGVSPQYNFNTKLRLFFEPFTRGLFYLSILLLGLLSQNWIVWVIAGSFFLARLIIQLSILNVAAHRLQGQWVALSIIFFDIFLPLNNIYLMTRHAIRKKIWKIDVW